MKKLLALLLAVCLMATLFAGCNSAPADDSSAPKGDDKGSSATNPADKNDDTEADATVANIADFAGTWKHGTPWVACYTIDADNNTVTAYRDNGYVVGTFPVVATKEGIVLKMGTFGLVTLKSADDLVAAEVPEMVAPALAGDWNMIYGELSDDTYITFVDATEWTMTGNKADKGTYSIKDNGEVELSPTKELGGNVYHRVLGGGEVLEAYQPSSRIYVKKSTLETKEGQALANYYDLIMNKWVASDDANYTVTFTGNGQVEISGTNMGIWYPTSTGATVEMTDGSTQYVEFSDNGIDFYYKSFTRK